MPKIVIADTSCFIVLEKIQQLPLLQKIYLEVITTPEIQIEFANPLPNWVLIRSAKNLSLQQELETKLDRGEASAIALGLEFQNSTIILDDLKASKVAEQYKINFTGTLGVLLKAKELRLISSLNL
jgi:predicted nucleic acid-binding protein